MASATSISPSDTAHSVLHAVIREHLEPFVGEVSDRGDGSGLTRFVEQAFREFLACGVLAHGFTHLRCADCTFEPLVLFSCKRRRFCPSCGGRRMAERATYLLDEELPRVPARQWVLTLPYPLRYRLAWDHTLCRAVLGVYARVPLACSARTAPSHGIQEAGPATGTVTLIQRFGSGLLAHLARSHDLAPGPASPAPARHESARCGVPCGPQPDTRHCSLHLKGS